MRFVRAVAAVACAISLTACSSDPTAPLNHEFTIGVGETAHVTGADLSIKFVELTEDSRCPTTLQCIWAGNGQVELEARSNGQTTVFALNTTQGAREFVVNSFHIALVSLAPIRVDMAPPPAGSYHVTLVVTEAGTVCTQEARPALMVALADSATGATSGFTNVSVVVRDGTYADSVVQATYPAAPFNGPVGLAYERAGTYIVTVRASGYVPWTRAGVTVSSDRCHVASVGLTARLAR